MGVEPTEDIKMPPNGFEVREAHRDLSAPAKQVKVYPNSTPPTTTTPTTPTTPKLKAQRSKVKATTQVV